MAMIRESKDTLGAESVQSSYFGRIARDPSSEIHLPLGIPGFESETCLVVVEIPDQRPLVYLQSVSDPGLCFLALPANTLAQDFELRLNDDERIALFLSDGEQLVPGDNVLALAILFPAGKTVQANLSAPLVINLRKMVGIQSLPAPEKEQRRVQLQDGGNWMPIC